MQTRYHSYQVMLDNYVDFFPPSILACSHNCWMASESVFFDFFFFNKQEHIYYQSTFGLLRSIFRQRLQSREPMWQAHRCGYAGWLRCLKEEIRFWSDDMRGHARRPIAQWWEAMWVLAGNDLNMLVCWVLLECGLVKKGRQPRAPMLHACKCVRVCANVQGCAELLFGSFKYFLYGRNKVIHKSDSISFLGGIMWLQ